MVVFWLDWVEAILTYHVDILRTDLVDSRLFGWCRSHGTREVHYLYFTRIDINAIIIRPSLTSSEYRS